MFWFNKIKIAHRLSILSLILVLSLFGISAFFLNMYKNDMLEQNKARLQHIVQLAEGTIQHYYSLSQKDPDITPIQAQEMARNALRDLRYGDNDYIFVYKEDGTNMVTGTNTKLEGQNLLGMKDENGVLVIKSLIDNARRGQNEFLFYSWPRGSSEKTFPKVSYSAYFEPWDWMVGSGVYIDELDEKFMTALTNVAIIGFSILLIAVAISVAIAMSISRPLDELTGNMEKLARNDFNFQVKFTEFKDEIGKLARALSVFLESAKEIERLKAEQAEAEKRQAEEKRKAMNEMANIFESKVGTIVNIVGKAAQDMQAMAAQLSAGIEETSHQSAAVASASEQASSNVQTVAAAAEELSAAIKDISQNVTDTATTAGQCSNAAGQSKEKLDDLQTAVSRIDNVLQAIIEVAEQTNLLALNATIEAARAGDAGKGFAVVANEVKSLATKTHSMTEEISQLIDSIKHSSAATIHSVDDIMKRIEAVTEKTASIAAAIEEQNNSTLEISRNIHEAAQGTSEVSSNVVGIQQAANESAGATASLKESSNNLAVQAQELQKAVDSFISEVRAA